MTEEMEKGGEETQQGTATEAAKWYALQVYSGHENKVRTLLEKRIAESNDPNVIIQESKAFTCNVRAGRRGRAAPPRVSYGLAASGFE